VAASTVGKSLIDRAAVGQPTAHKKAPALADAVK